MTTATMVLAELAEKGAGVDVLRQIMQFMAQHLMELDVEVESRCGDAYDEKNLERMQSDATDHPVTASDRIALMLGTSPEMNGGIATVVSALRVGGSIDWSRVCYVPTHVDGGRLRKPAQFAKEISVTLRLPLPEEVAVVRAHEAPQGGLWRKPFLLWITRRFGVSTIFHLRGGGFDGYAGRGFGSRLMRWCIRRTFDSCSVVEVLSERWAGWARDFAPRSLVWTFGNPVCVQVTTKMPNSNGTFREGGRVLFLGMICDAENEFDLLYMWV